MRQISSFLGICLILISCRSENVQTDSSPKSHTEYYATLPLRESPYPDFQGVIQLTQEQAMERNHYRFEYDDKFRLKQISFQLGDTLIQPNHTANYFFTSPVQKFEYTDSTEVRTFYDRFGNAVAQRGANREIYVMDNLGKKTGLYFEDENHKRISNNWGIWEYSWDLQNDGSVIEDRFDSAGNQVSLRPHFEFHRVRLTYEQNGMLALMQNIDQDGNLRENSTGVAQDKLHFDQYGRWWGWTVLDGNHQVKRGNGPNVARGINVPDEWGYETWIRYEDVDGTPIINSHGFWGGKRYYDQYGNYEMTHFLDSIGNPGINEETGYCYAYYTWDESGRNRIRLDLKDPDGYPTIHSRGGFASVTYVYDERSNIIQTSYLGTDGLPINRKDNGVSVIRYAYDEKGKRTDTKRLDAAGVPVE